MNINEYYKYKADELKKSLKIFPKDFIHSSPGTTLSLPLKFLYPGREFFGKHEITFSDGSPWRICSNSGEAKFIIYSRQNGNTEVTLPDDEILLNSAVFEYEKYLDLMMKEIKKEFLIKFPDGDDNDAVAEILKYLNLIRY